MRLPTAREVHIEELAFTVRESSQGSRIVTSVVPLPSYRARLCDDLRDWGRSYPERTFLAERADGGWRSLSYGEAWRKVRSIGGALLQSGATPAAPLGLIAENGIDHGLVALGAMYAGIPVAPMSLGYVAPDASPARLRELLETLQPGALFAGDARIAAYFAAVTPDVPIFSPADPLDGDAAQADAAFERTNGDTVTKILFTSGSTGTPKGVITTNRMLCSNVEMASVALPEVAETPPVIVDWLPWSHCFGGSHNFDLILHNGGTLYVDDGRPAPGAFAATLRNLREIAPTLHFSVPRGFALLVETLNADPAFAKHFFAHLRVVLNAGASLPDPLRYELIRLARIYANEPVRIASSWGTTETAPLVTTSWGALEPLPETIGTPVPGVELKFAPSDGRFELRVRGPNVTSGYWRNPDATQAAFDDEGFYKTGDAGSLADERDPAQGVLFEGRLAENFKLSSGTWVNVGRIRLAVLEYGAPLIEDVVVTGHDRDELAALLFISPAHAAKLADLPEGAHAVLARQIAVREFVARALMRYNDSAPASSTRLARASIVPEPPNRLEGEITDKGTVNQRRALALRAAAVALLYADGSHEDVIYLKAPSRQALGSPA